MNLNEMIYRRRSTRSYTGEPVDDAALQKIKAFTENLKPLYPEINVRSEIVGRESIKCIMPWTTPQLIAIFSEEKDGFLENVGFMYQQLDLYMQGLGLGVCWLGMGRMKHQAVIERQNDNLKFVIMLAFGYPKDTALRSGIREFKRRTLSEISDRPDELLEPARIAPSSVNSQPWYFTHNGGAIQTYCVKHGLFGKRSFSDMNRVDIGICLAHLYISNPDTFRFFKEENAKDVKGYGYIGSVSI